MKVLFLGNGSFHSLKAEKQLRQMTCEVVFVHNDNQKYKKWEKDYDLGISFLYAFKVPDGEISCKQWINFHPAPLPGYGGRNLAYHAIMNDERQYGGTIHYMESSFDTGPIIAVNFFKIEEGDVAGDIFLRSCNVLIQMFDFYVPLLIRNEQPLESNIQKNTTYYKDMKIDDFITVSYSVKKEIRAKMFLPYTPKINIGGKVYKIVPDD
ncbi:formyltransferase family protein [Candidatus Pseudothioglobus singularis]|nr:formyltransferase family protein [Candidatus Pseudothioglobus singularis]